MSVCEAGTLLRGPKFVPRLDLRVKVPQLNCWANHNKPLVCDATPNLGLACLTSCQHVTQLYLNERQFENLQQKARVEDQMKALVTLTGRPCATMASTSETVVAIGLLTNPPSPVPTM